MATYQMETNLALGNEAESVPAIVDPLRDALNKMSGGAGAGDPAATFDVAPLTNNGYSSQVLVDHLVDGTYQFAFGSANRIPTGSDEMIFAHMFGMEIQEFISWWYHGTPGAGVAVNGAYGASEDSGAGLIAKQISLQPTENRGGLAGTHDYSNMVVFPICVTAGEAGGWYKEPVTLKKMLDGLWADGSAIKIRLADEPQLVHQLVFPNVATPAPVLSGSWLQDAINGVFNCGEYNMPLGDSSTTNGMFPNYPLGAGGIVDAGLKHYYVSSWGTPFRGRVLMINKTFWNGLTAQQRAWIEGACYQCHMANVSYMLQGQDAIIKNFQSFGAQIHESLPLDYLTALRQGADEVYDNLRTQAAYQGSTGNEYGEVLDHQRIHCRANQVRWRTATQDRNWRFASRLDYAPDLRVNSRY